MTWILQGFERTCFSVGHSPDEAEGPCLRRRTSYISYCGNHASGQGWPSYGSMRFFPPILTFAAGCRSYGSMVALPFLLIPPATPPPKKGARALLLNPAGPASPQGLARRRGSHLESCNATFYKQRGYPLDGRLRLP